MTNKDLNMIDKQQVADYDDGKCFELFYSEKIIYNDTDIFMISL